MRPFPGWGTTPLLWALEWAAAEAQQGTRGAVGGPTWGVASQCVFRPRVVGRLSPTWAWDVAWGPGCPSQDPPPGSALFWVLDAS